MNRTADNDAIIVAEIGDSDRWPMLIDTGERRSGRLDANANHVDRVGGFFHRHGGAGWYVTDAKLEFCFRRGIAAGEQRQFGYRIVSLLYHENRSRNSLRRPAVSNLGRDQRQFPAEHLGFSQLNGHVLDDICLVETVRHWPWIIIQRTTLTTRGDERLRDGVGLASVQSRMLSE